MAAQERPMARRVLQALGGQQPDKVPIYENWIDEPIVAALAKQLGFEGWAGRRDGTQSTQGSDFLDMYCFLVKELGLDATSWNFSTGLNPVNDEYVRDKYGCVYRLSGHGEGVIVEGPIKEASDLRGYDMASRVSLDDFADVQHVIEQVSWERAHFVDLTDPFKTSWLLRGGMEKLLIDYMLDPGLVHGLARVATDFDLALVDAAAKVGVDVLFMNGDLAGEKMTIISPRHYREYVKPYHQEVVEYVHRKGLKIVKHTDGNVWPILGDFVEVGFDGFHPVQPQCMDIGAVKAYLAGRMGILGNVDCRDLLPFGTEAEVEEAVRQTIEIAAPGGGYILCSSNSIHPGCKPENYLAMIRAAHKYRDCYGGQPA
jgi:uroporphyrinogen decarboxylase